MSLKHKQIKKFRLKLGDTPEQAARIAGMTIEQAMERLGSLSAKTRAICAALMDRSPAEVAVQFGMKMSAVYLRRRRAEQVIGVRLPRLHRVGRPPKDAAGL